MFDTGGMLSGATVDRPTVESLPALRAVRAVTGVRSASAADQRPAEERSVPVLDALAPLLPDGALRRGSTVAVVGSTALALALLAGPSQAGAWCAVVGMPTVSGQAAAEFGISVARLAFVPTPGSQWSAAVAALLDGIDVVAVAPPGKVSGGEARRLAARARERGAILVPFGAWEGADMRLSISASRWVGLGRGLGRLHARQVQAHAHGRGMAARPRHTALWLPAAGGGVESAVATVPDTDLQAEAG